MTGRRKEDAGGVAGQRSTRAAEVAQRPVRLLLMLVPAAGLGPFAMQFFLPAIPAIQAGFAVPAAIAQLTLSLSAFSIALGMLLFGPLADRVGRRPALLGGLVVYLLGSIMCATAPSIGVLVAGRIVQAAGASAGLVISRTIVRDLFEREQAAPLLAYLTMALVTAPMIAPALGGLLTDHLGWRAIFAAGALLGVVILAAVALLLPETRTARTRTAGRERVSASFLRLLRSRPFRGYAFCVAFSVGVLYTYFAAAPYLMVAVLRRPASEYGLWLFLLFLGYMVGNFMAARLAGRFRTEALIRLGSGTALLVALVLLALVLTLPLSPLLIFAPAAFIALGLGLATPNGQAALLSVDPQVAGLASGLGGFFPMGGAALTAQAVG